MTESANDPFSETIAARMQSDAHLLAARWFDRLAHLLPVRQIDVFPSDTILDQVPALIAEIGRFVGAREHDIVANTFVVARARELGELRHLQRASVHQLLREHDLLRRILESFVVEEAARLNPAPGYEAALTCVRRINDAVAMLTQATVDTFVGRLSQTVAGKTRRLEAFNRMLTHELRQPLAALEAGAALLRADGHGGGDDARARATADIQRNIARVVDLVDDITRVARLADDADRAPSVQRVRLGVVAAEAARQLRDVATRRDVTIRVSPDLPDVVVDLGRLELLLTSLLANAIKYSDRNKAYRTVDVFAVAGAADGRVMFAIRDNGPGMDQEHARRLLAPRAGAPPVVDAEPGPAALGLALVRDCADAIGAIIRIDTAPGEGTTFTLSVPIEPDRQAPALESGTAAPPSLHLPLTPAADRP